MIADSLTVGLLQLRLNLGVHFSVSISFDWGICVGKGMEYAVHQSIVYMYVASISVGGIFSYTSLTKRCQWYVVMTDNIIVLQMVIF